MDDVVAVEVQRLIAHHRASLTAVTDVDNVAVTAEIGRSRQCLRYRR